MTKSVAVLGCGPSGLMVAHAASLAGWDFRIYSKKRKSHLFGSQYLHEPIPHMTDVSGGEIVRYSLEGSAADYRRKVYGEAWDGTTSPEDLSQTHFAWNIRETYECLWRTYKEAIVDLDLGNCWPAGMDARSFPGHDLVISTVPRKIWAQPGDVFRSTKIWTIGDAPELDQEAPFTTAHDNMIICDGTDDVGWYRLSRVFGYTTIEWPHNRKPPVPGVVEAEKPLNHNSTAASDFIHLGRYGAWEKGVLTTDVFRQASQVLFEDMM